MSAQRDTRDKTPSVNVNIEDTFLEACFLYLSCHVITFDKQDYEDKMMPHQKKSKSTFSLSQKSAGQQLHPYMFGLWSLE